MSVKLSHIKGRTGFEGVRKNGRWREYLDL